MNKMAKSVICRVCLRADPKVKKKCLSLFEKHNDYFIFELINSIADVKIKRGDTLPGKICPDCLLELDTVLSFKRKCENSNILLKTSFLYNKIPIEPQSLFTQPLEEIKKEEPEEVSEYLEAEYLDENYVYPTEGESFKAEVSIEVEEINTNENEIVDTLAKKSRAIDLKLECNECGGLFKSKCKMRVHWKKVHMYESLCCPRCKRAFKSYKAFNLHMKKQTISCQTASKISIEGMGKSRIFHCNKCQYSSKRIKDLTTHLVVHTGEKPFVCKICSLGCSQQSSLQDHMERKHQIYHVITTCHYCGKLLKGRSKTYKHMLTHKLDYVQCDLCKKMLKTKKSLIDHLRRHSGIKSYTCDQCAKTFCALAELCNHRRVIHEKGKHIYPCDICGYKAFSSAVLKKHKARHTESNLPCLECGMFLENEQKLTEHKKRHNSAERKYPCPHCEKRYMNRKSLSQHVREIHKCRFLMNKPVVKQETPEFSGLHLKTFVDDNMIEVEVPP